MMSTNATYQYGDQQTLVTLMLDKHRLVIQLEPGKETYWYYDQVMKLAPTSFSYPGYPQQILSIHSDSFSEALTQAMQRQTGSIRKHRGSTLLKLLLIFVALGLLFYFFALPRLAAGMASKVPVSYEKQLGEQMYQALSSTFEVDKAKTAYINSFFDELKIPSAYNIQITVVKSDIANAFAMPGGRIVVYDKILQGMQSHEELAALLAHEFTHIEKRHSLRSMFRQLSSQVFFTLLMGDVTVAGSILLQNADNLKQLSYSRELETESDEYGAQLLADRGINCNGFVRLFQLLKKEMGSIQPNEWLSSHPDLENRVQNIQSLSYCKQATSSNASLQTLFSQLKAAR
ncbi:MAG TPA: M48 family metallopeptidase [Flavisolibacter sp.]|nr:M48 family metallopeptidase [Flavisolibacter sp.]